MNTRFLAGAAASIFFFSSCGNNNTNNVAPAHLTKDSAIKVMAGSGIEILDPEASALIDSTAIVEDLAEGFKWSEGPLYIDNGDYLLFSDVPNNKIFKWKEGEGLSVYLEPSGCTGPVCPKKEPGSNGLTLDRDGNLVLCQQGDRRIGRMLAPLNSPKPEFVTIVDHYKGKRLNSPNDAIYHSNGNLYFVDPPYGLDGRAEDPAKELEHQGVYRVKPDGTIDLVTSEFDFPNGITFSPDGKFLLVGHSNPKDPRWMKYELNDDGLVKSKSVFHIISAEERKDDGVPDGMKMHSKGYLFASGPGGIWVFNPSGKVIAKIHTGQTTSNCAFTKDEKTMYITCHTHIARVKLK